jgi:cytochrome c-type biogenesis protein CcmH/NrfF
MVPNRSEAGNAKVLAVAAVLAAVVGLAAGWWVAQPAAGLSQFDRLAGEIGCQCGTCPLRPIATCGCGFADGMLAELEEHVTSGQSDEEIMVAFIASYNESIRIAPSTSGLNLTAWAAPMLLLTVGAVALAGLILRWVSIVDTPGESASGKQPTSTASTNAESSHLHDLVERELEEMDR